MKHLDREQVTSMPDVAVPTQVFRRAPFVAELGMELESLGEGECLSILRVEPRHLRQDGAVHAGSRRAFVHRPHGEVRHVLGGVR